MGCADAVRRLWAYLESELDEADHRAVDEHLAWCLRCCGELEFARELQSFLRDRSGIAIPDDARARLEHFIDTLGDPPGEEVWR